MIILVIMMVIVMMMALALLVIMVMVKVMKLMESWKAGGLRQCWLDSCSNLKVSLRLNVKDATLVDHDHHHQDDPLNSLNNTFSKTCHKAIFCHPIQHPPCISFFTQYLDRFPASLEEWQVGW